MLPIIAIIRVEENAFVHYDLAKGQFSDKFSVSARDEYLGMSYGQLTFAEYDDVNQMSTQLISVTVSSTKDHTERSLKDLPREELVEMINHIYADLNLDKRSEGQESVLKH